MTPHNDGQGAMDLIIQLEGKCRKYKAQRNKWRLRVYTTMLGMTLGTVRFNLGFFMGMGVVSIGWAIVLKGLGKI